jgi:hypothetical protein
MKIIDSRNQPDNKTSLEEDKRIMNEFLANPENKKMAIELAHQIMKEIGDDWFQHKQLKKIFKNDEKQIAAKLTVLGAFNLCAYKQKKDAQWYKIDIDQKTQRVLVQQEIEFHEAQISILKEKLTRLN